MSIEWFVRFGEFKQFGSDEVHKCFHVCSKHRVDYWQYWYLHADTNSDECFTAVLETIIKQTNEGGQFADFFNDLSDDDVIWCGDSKHTVKSINLGLFKKIRGFQRAAVTLQGCDTGPIRAF